MKAYEPRQYISRFRSGSRAMGGNAIDYFRCEGKIIEHSWGMGGQSFKRVNLAPKSIEGYVLHAMRDTK